MKWMAALFFAFGIGNALPAAARYSRADELAIPNGARSNREVNFNENWNFFLGDTAAASRPDFADNHWRTLDLPMTGALKAVLKRLIRPVTTEGIIPAASVGTARHSISYRTPDVPKPPSISKEFT